MATDTTGNANQSTKPLPPAKDVEEKMRPMTRKAFGEMLKRAFTGQAPKPRQSRPK
jgi:hypothetical protein